MKKDLKKLMSIKRKEAVQMKNNQKGITLIALIITIIVMLILVAVTVNVALNGGLFDNAREAKTKTQRAAEKEELMSIMIGAYTSSGNFATSNVGDLPSGTTWCTEETETWEDAGEEDVTPTGYGDWVITSNNNKFYIDADGSVLDSKPNPWIGWGLTSSVVKYNVPYTGSILDIGAETATITIYSNGSIYISWDGKTYSESEVAQKIGQDWCLEDNIFFVAAPNTNGIAFKYELDNNNYVMHVYTFDISNPDTTHLADSINNHGVLFQNALLTAQN